MDITSPENLKHFLYKQVGHRSIHLLGDKGREGPIRRQGKRLGFSPGMPPKGPARIPQPGFLQEMESAAMSFHINNITYICRGTLCAGEGQGQISPGSHRGHERQGAGRALGGTRVFASDQGGEHGYSLKLT
jgi:hypothetical protein